MGLQTAVAYIGADEFLNTVETDRQFIAALYPTSGIIETAALNQQLVTTGGGRTINVSAHKSIIKGAESTTQGNYFLWSDETDTLNWPAPDTMSRIDTLVMRVVDRQYGTTQTQQGARYDIVPGVPASNPVARTDTDIRENYREPGTWFRLADIQVNPGDTGAIPQSQITQRWGYVLSSARPMLMKTSWGGWQYSNYAGPDKGHQTIVLPAGAMLTITFKVLVKNWLDRARAYIVSPRVNGVNLTDFNLPIRNISNVDHWYYVGGTVHYQAPSTGTYTVALNCRHTYSNDGSDGQVHGGWLATEVSYMNFIQA